MTKIVLQDIASLTNETAALAAINSNSAIIETASDNSLSRDGTSPNQMLADLDMNSKRILNLPAPLNNEEPLRLQDLTSFTGTGLVLPQASYVTLGASGTLTAERVLTAGSGITLTDGGANSTITTALDTTNARNKLHPTSTDTAIAKYTGTSGDLANSGVLIDSSNNISGLGYGELSEIASPSNPAADKLRVFAKDVAGITHLFTRDSAGTEADLNNSAGTLALNNTWTGDNYFKTGRPFADVRAYGAVGNGSTDDATAIQAAITAIQSLGGGTVYFPPGSYKVNSTITINSSSSVQLLGASLLSSLLFTNTDTKLLLIQGTGRHSVENMQILGVGIQGGTGPGCNGNSHTIHIDTTCVDVCLSRLLIAGGFDGVHNNGVDTIADRLIIYNVYGSALWSQNSIALWMRRCKLDNPWPVSVPTGGATKAAWAATTAYTVGTVVSVGTMYIQCRVAGTSGGSAPTLQNYGTDIVDGGGTLRWRCACSTTSSALQITSGASEVHVSQTDLTGAQARSAIRIDNDGATTAPFLTTISDSIISQTFGSSLDAIAGSGLSFSGNEVGPPIDSAAAGIALRASWVGDANIVNNQIFGDIAAGHIGVYLGTGINATVVGNTIVGWVTGITIDNTTSKFVISANNVGSSTKWGANNSAITVTVAAHDRYNITNNIINGAGTGITDGGTGVNKTLTGNQ